jgi:hypothetical protein
MPDPEQQELQVRIDELIAGTRKGAFQWRAVNPTTYLWEKVAVAPAKTARLTLQRVEQSVAQASEPGHPPTTVRQSFVIMQGIELQGNSWIQRISLSGQGDPALNNKLQELFNLAASGWSQQALEFMKNVVAQADN